MHVIYLGETGPEPRNIPPAAGASRGPKPEARAAAEELERVRKSLPAEQFSSCALPCTDEKKFYPAKTVRRLYARTHV